MVLTGLVHSGSVGAQGTTTLSPSIVATKLTPWAEIGGHLGLGARSHAELAYWSPLMDTGHSVLFADLRGMIFEQQIKEGNAALGYRRLIDEDRGWGLWAGVDLRHSLAKNLHWQSSGGLEFYTSGFDLRLNGYLPLSGAQQGDHSTTEFLLSGSSITMVGGREIPMRGFDAEIGNHFDIGPATLGFYGGAYWFDDKDAFEPVTGGKLRASLSFDNPLNSGSRFSADYSYTNDPVRGTNHRLGARLRFALGPKTRFQGAYTTMQNRLMERIERDTDIIIGQSAAEPVEDAQTGVWFEQVAYLDDSQSRSDVQANIDNTGENTLLIANGAGDGIIEGNIRLNANQTLMGGGGTIEARGRKTGALGYFKAPGQRPDFVHDGTSDHFSNGLAGIDNDRGGPVIIVSNRSHISGLGLRGADPDLDSNLGCTTNCDLGKNHGISAGTAGQLDSKSDAFVVPTDLFVVLDDLTIRNLAGNGINFKHSIGSTVWMSNITIAQTAGASINFSSSDGNHAVFRNVSVQQSGNEGISFESGDDQLGHEAYFYNVTVQNTYSEGISFETSDRSFFRIADSKVINAGEEGISAESADFITAELINVFVKDAGDESVSFQSASQSNVSLLNVQIENSGQKAIGLNNLDDSVITLEGITITHPGQEAIGLKNANNSIVTLDDVTVLGTVASNNTPQHQALVTTLETGTDYSTINGTINSHVTNNPALCLGGFNGTITFVGTSTATITDGWPGNGCLPFP